MNKYNAIELVLDILSLVIFLGYHFWLFFLQRFHPKGHIRIGRTKWFNVYDMSSTARLLWTHSLAQDEKEAITAVQTVSIFTQSSTAVRSSPRCSCDSCT